MPFKEAIDYFRQKVNVPSAHWTAVMDEAHARSFAVAGATDKALIEDFRQAIDSAIADGTGFDKFRGDFYDIVKKHGWAHTGRPSWRAKVIYNTNLRTAFAAGRYAQMTQPAVLAAFPYWQYHHVNCPNPRLQHLAWDGMVLRADDGFWDTCFPPNGFGCHCYVTSCGERDLARMGKSGPDPSPDLQWRDYINRTTGVVVKVPSGVDPGFAYNPGKAWLQGAKPVVRSPPLKPLDAPPPVLAPEGRSAVKPAVITKFLEAPANDSVQVGALPAASGHAAAPVILPGAVVRAARAADVAIDAALVAAIIEALPAASGAEHQPETRAVIAQGHVVALHWNGADGLWMVAGIRKDQ